MLTSAVGVLGDYRGRGLATHLIKAQEEYARLHFPSIGVKSSPRWKEMLRLLIKLDYILCGFKANEWGTNSAVWFEKNLIE
jgi:GNAT superfamily N-acetyltransferase